MDTDPPSRVVTAVVNQATSSVVVYRGNEIVDVVDNV